MRKARNDLLAQARAIRAATQTAARYLPNEAALAQPLALYDEWSGESVTYELNDIRRHGGLLYRCLIPHTSQAAWTPTAAPSLWTRIADPKEAWPDWIQPAGSHNAYTKGDKVSHGGKRWISAVDANVWEPGAEGVTQWAEAE